MPSTRPPRAAGGRSRPRAADEPRTLEAALARVEKTLGRYDPENQREWRVPSKTETKTRPEPDGPEVLLRAEGVTVVGLPFLSSGSVCFDEVEQWEQRVYDLVGGKETLTRHQKTHSVVRYALSRKGEVWLASGVMLSSGVHDAVGKPTLAGVERWRADGFELVGDTGPARYFGPGGSWVLGTSYGGYRYSRDGDRLVVKSRFQSYHLAAGPGGAPGAGPDFKRPFGSSVEVESKSEPAPGAGPK